jgi:hypothetical protein
MCSLRQAYGSEAGVAALKWMPFGGKFPRISFYLFVLVGRSLSYWRFNTKEY